MPNAVLKMLSFGGEAEVVLNIGYGFILLVPAIMNEKMKRKKIDTTTQKAFKR